MWQVGGQTCQSRLMLGTANYPSLAILCQAVKASNTDILTVSLKRENALEKSGKRFWETVSSLGCNILPNTAGCHKASEAVYIAQLAQDIFQSNWIKLEVTGDDSLLQPHSSELLKAAEHLIKLGFEVFPFCTEDFLVCQQLVEVGCQILMPWGAPIGSGKGLLNTYALKVLRMRFPHITLVIDAGIGSPLHALEAMLLGFDAILVNSAIARAVDPVRMAQAFRYAVDGGHLALQAGVIEQSDVAIASTPLWHTIFGHKLCNP